MDDVLIILIIAMFAIPTTAGVRYMVDQGTLRECATNGESKMVGGGTIKCEVVREVK